MMITKENVKEKENPKLLNKYSSVAVCQPNQKR